MSSLAEFRTWLERRLEGAEHESEISDDSAKPAKMFRDIKKRVKRLIYDRYFRWDTDVTAPGPRISNREYKRDKLMMWLSYINPGMLDLRNLSLLDYCIENLPTTAPVLEIGSFAGLSLNNIIQLLRRHQRPNQMFSVDEWNFEDAGQHNQFIPGSNITYGEYRSHCIETFRRNVALFSHESLPHHIVLSADAFFRAWAAAEEMNDFWDRPTRLGGPISLAYIDGDHTYEQSRKDFENVDRFLDLGGFIVFDDSADRARSAETGAPWGSAQTAREVAALRSYRVIDKTYHYCVQKIAR